MTRPLKVRLTSKTFQFASMKPWYWGAPQSLQSHFCQSHPIQSGANQLTFSLQHMPGTSLGGFLETYEALCDYNGFPFREEIQWVRIGPFYGELW